MNPYIKKLYPNVKRTFWTTTIVRGGGKVLDHPIAAQPHIDYNQNDADRIAFHKEHPILESTYFTDEGMLDKTEPGIMMGMQDTEDSKLGAILGIWKPLSPSKVYLQLDTLHSNLDIMNLDIVNFAIYLKFYYDCVVFSRIINSYPLVAVF